MSLDVAIAPWSVAVGGAQTGGGDSKSLHRGLLAEWAGLMFRDYLTAGLTNANLTLSQQPLP